MLVLGVMRVEKSRGFTLIELLVVIAIIGILASVVLASLNTARDKSKDASIKSQMGEMRKQAAVFYSDKGTYIGTGAAATNDSYTECTGSGFDNTVFDFTGNGDMGKMMEGVWNDAQGAGARVFCTVHPASWAFAAPLHNPTGSNTGWCVDSSGAAKEVSFSFNTTGTHLNSGGVARCP